MAYNLFLLFHICHYRIVLLQRVGEGVGITKSRVSSRRGTGRVSTPHSESLGAISPSIFFANTKVTMKLAIRILLIVGSVTPY